MNTANTATLKHSAKRRVYYGHSIAAPETATPIGPQLPNLLHPGDLDVFLARCRAADWVTFDDGFADNLTTALPLLEKHGVKAIIFVTTGFVGRSHVQMERIAAHVAVHGSSDDADLAELGAAELGPAARYRQLRKRFKSLPAARRMHYQTRFLDTYNLSIDALVADMLTPEQVAELDAHPLITIAAHTVSHPNLCSVTDKELAEELRQSKSVLEQWLGRSVPGMSYPYGENDRRVRQATRAAGYHWAYATKPNPWQRRLPVSNRFRLPRYDLGKAAVDGKY